MRDPRQLFRFENEIGRNWGSNFLGYEQISFSFSQNREDCCDRYIDSERLRICLVGPTVVRGVDSILDIRQLLLDSTVSFRIPVRCRNYY